MNVNKAVRGASRRADESQQKANKKEWNEVYSSHPILWINVEITAYDDEKERRWFDSISIEVTKVKRSRVDSKPS
jgi:hypothetical protein